MKPTIMDVYKAISTTREVLKENNKNINDPIKQEKWEEVISAYAWVMGLLEETEEINPEEKSHARKEGQYLG